MCTFLWPAGCIQLQVLLDTRQQVAAVAAPLCVDGGARLWQDTLGLPLGDAGHLAALTTQPSEQQLSKTILSLLL